jgi:hypothetical protein
MPNLNPGVNQNNDYEDMTTKIINKFVIKEDSKLIEFLMLAKNYLYSLNLILSISPSYLIIA